ncbi:low-density lipoprotein receptor 1-like [Contarinia nasturtii]|uniref:low-density lipoprotein receptor 1-like n=1 Tax=Contarinia nasturtii TaxID=265458 RepID=UPI0012D3F2D3|nr:low-density lipoprotein receptor 1-like [Contarinia nasturtii]
MKFLLLATIVSFVQLCSSATLVTNGTSTTPADGALTVTNQEKTTKITTTSNSTTSIACKPGEFTCKSSNQCIPHLWLCDNEYDCSDTSDEDACENKECKPWMFSCDDGHCIYSTWRCDGDLDCRNGKDEESCTTSAGTG